jgi:peptidoglycan hydrolase-like protein with peptidoglycan-binding domain
VLGNVIYSPYFTDATMTSLGSPTTTVGSTTTATYTSDSQTTATTTFGNVTVEVSASTTISGPAAWDGTFDLPTATSTSALPSSGFGYDLVPIGAIEIGAGDVPLTFSQPVKITFTGKANNSVGWTQGGVFKKITEKCDSPTNPTLAAGADCFINVSGDLVVWTKHATTFIAFEQVSSYGTGGTPSSGASSASVTPTTPAASQASPTGTPKTETSGQVLGASTSASQGQVLGVSAVNFTHNLAFGSRGTDVIELHKMLIAGGYLKIAAPTGYFGPLTKAALTKWQKENNIPSTGLFGAMSRGFLNKDNQ